MRLVCPAMIFSTPYDDLLKELLLHLIERAFKLILPVMIRKRFSLLQTKQNIKYGLVRMYVTPHRISWIIFTSDLVISYADKLLVFRLVQIVLLL